MHAIPGVRPLVDGYGDLLGRLERTFTLRRALPGDRPDAPVNLVEFAYDWRLSCRYNARLLAARVDEALGRRRATAGPPPSIRMYGADENELPILRHSPAVNMDALHLLHPAFLPPPPAQGRIPDPTAFLARGTGTKRYTVLATGTTDSETDLRAELAGRNMNVQWIQLEDTTGRG